MLLLSASILPLVAHAGDDDLADQLPRLKPTEPAEAIATFRVHEGFRLDLVAAEPLVTDPVAACFDEHGRLYVVEMRGYPYPEDVPTGRVVRLEDRDGDGRFDASTVFLDGLSWPTGVVPYRGGVFVAVAPDILYARDDDGDGKADTRKVMFTGFGKENVQALLNGLLWGPDGWIYGASGGNGGEVRNASRPTAKAVSVRGRDFRFRPDGSAFEAISGGGQFGHGFDDWGHRFVCNNSDHIRQVVLPSRYLERNPYLVPPPVVQDIAVEGGAAPVFRISPPEPWRVVRTKQRAADPEFVRRAPPTELSVTGFFTSATGVTIYRGSAYSDEYRGNAFIGDVGGNLVHRKVLRADGPIERAERADPGVEFLASTDNWFRPVNFANTPRGTLLILDMYRETIEHPWSIPEPIKAHLDLTSGHDRGRLYELIQEGVEPRPSRPLPGSLDDVGLAAALEDPDAWTRETAQRLLIERGERLTGDARGALESLARTSASPLGRVHALWTLDALGLLTPEILRPAFDQPDPGVREQAARLAERFLRGDPTTAARLAALADDPDAKVRFQTAFSLGEAPGPGPLEALARVAVRDPGDRLIRVAVLSSVGGREVEFAGALDAAGLFGQAEGRAWAGDLAELVGARKQPGPIGAFLERFAGRGADPTLATAAALGLGEGLRRSGASLRDLLGPGSTLNALLDRAREAASSPGDEATRVDAIRLLGMGPMGPALETLPALLDARQPAAVQLAALQALGSMDDGRVGKAIAGRWRSLSPATRREAAEVLLARPDRVDALLDAVEAGTIAPRELDPTRIKRLLDSPDQATRARAGRLLSGEPNPSRAEVLARYRDAAHAPGDPERGRRVFREQCATCHRADGEGHAVGPDLATVAGRPPEDLLVQILDPNREVAPGAQSYTLATADGRVLTGLIAEETHSSLTLVRAEGARDVVARSEVAELTTAGLSLMPEGLEAQVDPGAMADLIAFLRSIQPAADRP
jgi:putative membrane-bound dehydrogenase-like protein